MSGGAGAWICRFGEDLSAAVALDDALHVVEDRTLLFDVPLAPRHCSQVMLWQGRVLPVLKIAALLESESADSEYVSELPVLLVVGWTDPQARSHYGVLQLTGLPQRSFVHDAQAVEPDVAAAKRWQNLALGFFAQQGQTIPILDLPRAFNRPIPHSSPGEQA